MMLFDELALFDEGRKRFTTFALPDTDLRLWEQFFPRSESDEYFRLLKDSTPWQQRIRNMYEKMLPDPRLTAYFGGPNGLEWTPTLLAIKYRVETECALAFNRVLLNFYRDGNDSVAWHSDTLPADGKHHPIASVTFGETRVFKVRPKSADRAPTLDIPLKHGSLLLMGAGMQDHFEHHIPKTSRPIGPRINLTFRISDTVTPIYSTPAAAIPRPTNRGIPASASSASAQRGSPGS